MYPFMSVTMMLTSTSVFQDLSRSCHNFVTVASCLMHGLFSIHCVHEGVVCRMGLKLMTDFSKKIVLTPAMSHARNCNTPGSSVIQKKNGTSAIVNRAPSCNTCVRSVDFHADTGDLCDKECALPFVTFAAAKKEFKTQKRELCAKPLKCPLTRILPNSKLFC
ncbi:hypothetical protein CEXT_119771 [Caerostris extrusa]|uniref:Uncharacterized protein n=1 Tax=Caerostris extrusa TaxID=172846 RepID=A0AAV4U523_CAEEX|nr:hypothetical protein CEXT_119771 [Caerostris extrusa]